MTQYEENFIDLVFTLIFSLCSQTNGLEPQAGGSEWPGGSSPRSDRADTFVANAGAASPIDSLYVNYRVRARSRRRSARDSG